MGLAIGVRMSLLETTSSGSTSNFFKSIGWEPLDVSGPMVEAQRLSQPMGDQQHRVIAEDVDSRWQIGTSVHKLSKRDQNVSQWMLLVRFPWRWCSKVSLSQWSGRMTAPVTVRASRSSPRRLCQLVSGQAFASLGPALNQVGGGALRMGR